MLEALYLEVMVQPCRDSCVQTDRQTPDSLLPVWYERQWRGDQGPLPLTHPPLSPAEGSTAAPLCPSHPRVSTPHTHTSGPAMGPAGYPCRPVLTPVLRVS